MLEKAVRRSDILMTFNQASRASRLIAWLDSGPWSHVAMIGSGNMVMEATPPKVRSVGIETYLKWPHRLALLRLATPLTGVQADALEDFHKTQIGMPYAYAKASLTMLRKLLHLPTSVPLPNELAASPSLMLICRV